MKGRTHIGTTSSNVCFNSFCELKIHDCSRRSTVKNFSLQSALFFQRIFFTGTTTEFSWFHFIFYSFLYICIRVTRHKLFVLKFNRDLIRSLSLSLALSHSVREISFTILQRAIKKIYVYVCKMRPKRFLAYNLTDVFAMCILSFNVKLY